MSAFYLWAQVDSLLFSRARGGGGGGGRSGYDTPPSRSSRLREGSQDAGQDADAPAADE